MGSAMRQTRVKKGTTAKTAPKKAVPKKVSTKGSATVAPQKVTAQTVLKKGATPTTPAAPLQRHVIPVAEKPSAVTCPLVLDGIIAPEAFTPRDCFSCDEFDCRFYAAEERSGLLGSRLFACDEEGDEDGEDADLLEGGRGEDEGDTWGDEEDE